jgi:hypothetical protein
MPCTGSSGSPHVDARPLLEAGDGGGQHQGGAVLAAEQVAPRLRLRHLPRRLRRLADVGKLCLSFFFRRGEGVGGGVGGWGGGAGSRLQAAGAMHRGVGLTVGAATAAGMQHPWRTRVHLGRAADLLQDLAPLLALAAAQGVCKGGGAKREGGHELVSSGMGCAGGTLDASPPRQAPPLLLPGTACWRVRALTAR